MLQLLQTLIRITDRALGINKEESKSLLIFGCLSPSVDSSPPEKWKCKQERNAETKNSSLERSVSRDEMDCLCGKNQKPRLENFGKRPVRSYADPVDSGRDPRTKNCSDFSNGDPGRLTGWSNPKLNCETACQRLTL